ncbi:MAG: hypothetical protein ABI274_16555 [Ktedonobacterales bacterium]
MGYIIELSDEQFATIEVAAPGARVVATGIFRGAARNYAEATRKPREVYDDLEDFFRAVGASEEEIEHSKRDADIAFPPYAVEDPKADVLQRLGSLPDTPQPF